MAAEAVRSLGEFEKGLARLGDELRAFIDLECEAFATDEAARAKRRARALSDFRFFCTTYFPHYVRSTSFSTFHEFVFQRFPEALGAAEGARDIYMAPRGEAKSTYTTQLGSLWAICTGRKHLIAIVMNIEEQAAEMLEAIKAELDSNPRLAMDFPEACGVGRIWQATTIVSNNNVKVRIGGSGKKLRGMRHGPYRPDLVILDDLENDENVRSVKQREAVQNFVLTTIVGLEAADGGMDVFWVGTSLHYDAAINRVARSPRWKPWLFRSIVSWPSRMDLWDAWESLYIAAAGGTAEEKAAAEAQALAFYRDNEAEMNQGAAVSWPEIRPLYSLMALRAVNHDAFSQEQQNEAGNNDLAPFKTLQFWVNRLPEWRFFGAIDPSLGKSGASGDPSALLIGGYNVATSTLDVVEADIARRVPDLIIARAIELQRQYGCVSWAVEAVQFQSFMLDELLKRAATAGVPFPAVAVKPTTDKALRIVSLQPPVKNGLIRFERGQHTLIDQLRFWPEADHDDGPDALEMLWGIAKQFSQPFSYVGAGSSRFASGPSRERFHRGRLQ